MRGTIALLAATALIAAATPASGGAHATGHSERLAARARRGDRVARTASSRNTWDSSARSPSATATSACPSRISCKKERSGSSRRSTSTTPLAGRASRPTPSGAVRAAVTHAVTARASLVRIPRPVLERRRSVRAARDALGAAGHEPSLTELAAATSLPRAAVAEALAPSGVVSLDQPLTDGRPLADHLAGNEERAAGRTRASARRRGVLSGLRCDVSAAASRRSSSATTGSTAQPRRCRDRV